MRVTVVRITVAAVTALSVGMVPLAAAPEAAVASSVSAIPTLTSEVFVPAPNGPGLLPPDQCATTSPGLVPATLSGGESTLSAGYWFEECRVGESVLLRNLTPSVWTIDLLQSGALDPRPTPSAIIPRYELFHSQYLPATLWDETIAPGETLVFSDVDQFVLIHDLSATTAWIASRATTKWLRDVADITLYTKALLDVAGRQGTAGAALADCYAAVEDVTTKWGSLSSDEVLTQTTAAVSVAMTSRTCIRALRAFHANPTVTRAAEAESTSIARTVASSVGKTAAVSALERFGPALRAFLAAR